MHLPLRVYRPQLSSAGRVVSYCLSACPDGASFDSSRFLCAVKHGSRALKAGNGQSRLLFHITSNTSQNKPCIISYAPDEEYL